MSKWLAPQNSKLLNLGNIHDDIMEISITCGVSLPADIILETEGSVRKIQKRALLHYKKVKKGTPDLASPYLHSLFKIVLIKQIFEKNKSTRAASGSRTQFKPKITSDLSHKMKKVFCRNWRVLD